MYRQRAIIMSVALHLSLLMIGYVGLPELFEEDAMATPMVITLDPLPITGKTNVKPSDKPIVKPKKDKPTPEKKQPPKKAAPAKKAPPKASPAVPKPKDTPPPKELPKQPKDTPTPDKQEPEKKETIDSVLKDIREQAREGDDKKAKPDKDATPTPNTTRSTAPYDPTIPLSLSERDAIASQFVQCWRLPAGSANDYSLKVSVDVNLRQDGSVIKAVLASDQHARYRRDNAFRAAADSAVRAVHRCSPIKHLPTKKYDSWKEMRMNFDPKDMLY